MFIDKPGPALPTGIWAVDLAELKPKPKLLTEQIAFYTADLNFRIELRPDATIIERLSTPLTGKEPSAETDMNPVPAGTTWAVPSQGQPISISPNHKRVAWQVSNEDLPFERRITQVWTANFDGSDAQVVAELPRGGIGGWISDDVLLLSGRESLEDREQILFTLSLINGHRVELARGTRLRGGLLSPDGEWLAYFVALDEDLAQNGLWLVRSDGSTRRKLEPELFGAFQWRDAKRLLIAPFRPDALSHEFWELDAETGQTRQLTNPEITTFKIANGDWIVSPNGQYVAFVNSGDHNIWVLRLPD